MRSGIQSLVDGEVLSIVDIGKWLSPLRECFSPVDARHPLVGRYLLDLAVKLGRKLRFADRP